MINYKQTAYSDEDERIRMYVLGLGFKPLLAKNCYYHDKFGLDVVFDLSASGFDKHSIMSNIFTVVMKHGENQFKKKLRTLLEIDKDTETED